MANERHSLDIAIVGGSLSGLFAAVPLLQLPQRHRITILERSGTPLLHDQGAGIVAGNDVQHWLKTFDLWTVDTWVPSKARVYPNRQGEIVDSEKLDQRMTSWDLVYHIGRANFDGLDSGHFSKTKEKVLSGPNGPLLKDVWTRASYEYGRAVQSLSRVTTAEGSEKVQVAYVDTREGSETKGEGSSMLVDFVICADGASSGFNGMRKSLLDRTCKRTYAGYVAFRGTAPERELDEDARKVFLGQFALFHTTGTQILGYTIPGPKGTLEPGERLVNWVWYWNFPEGSEELEKVMTDSDGKWHRYTIPTGGKMHPDVWERQKQRARDVLPPQFAQVVCKTQKPFVQSITDVEPPTKGTNVGQLLDGKAVLVGDALAAFRPHPAASTSQAAFDARVLYEAFTGQITWDEYEKQVLEYATEWQARGVMLGQKSQFETPELRMMGRIL